MKTKSRLYFFILAIYLVAIIVGCSDYNEISTTIESERKMETSDKKEPSEVESSQKEIAIVESVETIESSNDYEENFIVRDGVLLAYNGNSKEVIIPEGVTRIKEDQWKKLEKYTSIHRSLRVKT